ncbi:MAG: hypothetical protein IJP96_03295 [Synergistaceae bacterium]|nr:hypothetical protein [Synergistaceae bacterium]
MITYTLGGKEVNEAKIDERLSGVSYLKDYRLEQLNKNSYRIMILPEKNCDLRGLKGSVLDALVDVYGIKGNFEIDIITEDEELMPSVYNVNEKVKNRSENF